MGQSGLIIGQDLNLGFLNLSPLPFLLFDLPARETERDIWIGNTLKDQPKDLDCSHWLVEDIEQDTDNIQVVPQARQKCKDMVKKVGTIEKWDSQERRSKVDSEWNKTGEERDH